MKKILTNMVLGGAMVLSPFAGDGYAQSKENVSSLNAKQQNIVTISAFSANGNQEQLGQSLNEGLNAGLTINEIKEILVHLYAYAGFPRSLNAINIFETVVNERKKNGIKDVPGKEPDKEIFKNGKFEYGKDIQTKLTGTTAIGSAQKFVPIIDTFLKEHLFADIFSRSNLDYQSREIITISAMANLAGTESQLQSHLKVGRNIGLTEEQLRSIAFIISTKVGWQEGSKVTKMIDNMFNSKGKAMGITQNEPSFQKAAQQNPWRLACNSFATNEQSGMENRQVNMIFPKGDQAPGEYFTGIAWVNRLLPQDETGTYSVGNVVFAPGARTAWHTHPAGQTLIVLDGKGWYQEKGKPARSISKGDIVLIPSNTVHWHGAAKDSSLTHLAITNSKDGGVKWLQPVTEEEYNNHKR